ncbi:type 1 glutamine amidotransferase [Nocardioides sp. TF02-7]|uniref:type 1 glutamine amidotransferase n=1 Tax=Nocardioides sp. TF02-7 TaxID=2917724 RepID=UPI001F065398|nr:type 1 glutamine amidotransferase [Nocardioides sp. TF02-7]UMG94110.1 type 1 glutamine amidotransferase [Nocardioides sp. TF02-7]
MGSVVESAKPGGQSRRDERTVLVIQPDEHCPADLFGDWFEETGLGLRVVRPFAGDPVPTELAEGALMVLGGPMSANDDEEHPWLADVRDLLKVAVGAGAPTLGICLGGQLLARALGGRVTKGAFGPEIGVVELELHAHSVDDSLFSGLADAAPAATYHGDAVVELPSGAVLLAGSTTYPHQAFRVGPRAWGVQFHPEVSADRFDAWATAAPAGTLEAELVGPGAAEVRRREGEVVATGRALARRFAALFRP